MPFAERAGGRLHFEVAGTNDPTLVFVPGWCCDGTCFQPQFDHFRGSHRVVGVDLPGFGESSVSHHTLEVAAFADDVAWLCGHLGISKPIIVGHSLTGAVAIEVGARHQSLPAAVIALDPIPVVSPRQQHDAFAPFAAQLEGPDGESARRHFVENMCFATTDDADRKRRVTEMMCSVPITIAASAIRRMLDWDGAAALRGCQAPVLVLMASVGGMNDPASLRAIKPDIHMGVTVGSGHFHQLEVPDQVNAMIERFIRVAVPASATL